MALCGFAIVSFREAIEFLMKRQISVEGYCSMEEKETASDWMDAVDGSPLPYSFISIFFFSFFARPTPSSPSVGLGKDILCMCFYCF